MNKILKIFTNTLLTMLIIVLLIYVVLKFTNKIGIYEVMSSSMETQIHKGDYIIVKNTNNYKKGDIVTYKENDYYITHRIVEINGNKVITKGDANNTNDEEIDKNDIVGKYIFKIFKHKIINILINYKYIFIGVILVLFIITNIINRKYEKLS